MKKVLFFALMGTLMLGSFTSCNNKPQEPTQEEIDAQKQALADSVLAVVDAIEQEYLSASAKGFTFRNFKLTEAEKMVKPDYLLDPTEANKLVTRSQKVNALAIYMHELFVREIYDMPLEEAKEAASKLALDLNYPIDKSKYDEKEHSSTSVKPMYDKCRENGDLVYFWQFTNAILVESSFLIAQNPDLFLSKITEEEYQAFCNRWTQLDAALEELAKYDEEINEIWEFRKNTRIAQSPEDTKVKFGNLKATKQTYLDYKDKFIARRNALLQ